MSIRRNSMISAITVAALVLAGCSDEREWHAFKLEHHCTVVDRTPGTQSMMVIPNGNGRVTPMMHYIPGNTYYRCDDGKIHSRSE